MPWAGTPCGDFKMAFLNHGRTPVHSPILLCTSLRSGSFPKAASPSFHYPVRLQVEHSFHLLFMQIPQNQEGLFPRESVPCQGLTGKAGFNQKLFSPVQTQTSSFALNSAAVWDLGVLNVDGPGLLTTRGRNTQAASRIHDSQLHVGWGYIFPVS